MALYPSPRIRLQEVLERAKNATSTLTIYEDGSAVVPTSATFTLINDSNKKVIDAGAATIAGGGELSYVIGAGDIPASTAFSDNWLIEWNVTISGTVYTYRRTCAICRTKLYGVISDIDLTQFYSDLESIRPSSMTSFQQYIDEAWILIIERLKEQGNFPYLIISNQSLRQVHLDASFMLIWRDMVSSGLGEGRYNELMIEHRRSFEAGFQRLSFKYDSSESGIATEDKRRPAKAVIYTANPPGAGARRWWRRTW